MSAKKFCVWSLVVLALAALSTSETEAGWLCRKCCRPAPTAEYVVPVSVKDAYDSVDSAQFMCRDPYVPAACKDNMWVLVPDADKMGCVHRLLIGRPCSMKRGDGDESRKKGVELFPMTYHPTEKCDGYFTIARRERRDPIDAYLPRKYAQD